MTFHSATKAFNLGGIRIAVAVFGSDALHDRFKNVPRRTLGGHNCLGIPLTRIAWQQCDDWLAGVVSYLQGNRNFVTEFLARRMPAIGYVAPEATFFAWMDCRELDLRADPTSISSSTRKWGSATVCLSGKQGRASRALTSRRRGNYSSRYSSGWLIPSRSKHAVPGDAVTGKITIHLQLLPGAFPTVPVTLHSIPQKPLSTE